MSKTFCPDCGYALHRSHSRSLYEKLKKISFRQKLYRCHDCGWRGWLEGRSKPKPTALKKRLLPLVFTFLTTLLLTLLALYYASS